MHEVEAAARHGARGLREVDEAVHRLGEFGRAARPVAHLPGDEARIDRARAHDARQRRRQRTRTRPRRIGVSSMMRSGAAAERGRSRGKAADEGDVFRAFEQIARRIVAGMDQQVRGCDPRREGAGRERRRHRPAPP